jgi:hypothetical protein
LQLEVLSWERLVTVIFDSIEREIGACIADKLN